MLINPRTQLAVNKIKENTMAFGDVPASYTTLLELETTYIYTRAKIVSTLDTNVTLRFGGENTITILSNSDIDLHGFRFNDDVEIQYVSDPSSGSIQIFAY